MADGWFVRRSGVEKGPFSSSAIKEFARQRKLDPRDELRREGHNQWVQASRIRGLFPDHSPPLPSNPSQPQAPSPAPHQNAARWLQLAGSLIAIVVAFAFVKGLGRATKPRTAPNHNSAPAPSPEQETAFRNEVQALNASAAATEAAFRSYVDQPSDGTRKAFDKAVEAEDEVASRVGLRGRYFAFDELPFQQAGDARQREEALRVYLTHRQRVYDYAERLGADRIKSVAKDQLKQYVEKNASPEDFYKGYQLFGEIASVLGEQTALETIYMFGMNTPSGQAGSTDRIATALARYADLRRKGPSVREDALRRCKIACGEMGRQQARSELASSGSPAGNRIAITDTLIEKFAAGRAPDVAKAALEEWERNNVRERLKGKVGSVKPLQMTVELRARQLIASEFSSKLRTYQDAEGSVSQALLELAAKEATIAASLQLFAEFASASTAN